MIETKRLFIRPWKLKQYKDFHKIWGDPKVIWWGESVSLERSKQILIEEFELVKTMPKGCNWYAVQLKSGPIIGNLLLKKATYLNNPLELGWHFAKKYQGKGFATEAANPFIEYCFNEFNINYLTAIIVKDNEPSRNLAKRVSMKKSKQKIDYKGYIHELWEINKKDFNKI